MDKAVELLANAVNDAKIGLLELAVVVVNFRGCVERSSSSSETVSTSWACRRGEFWNSWMKWSVNAENRNRERTDQARADPDELFVDEPQRQTRSMPPAA